MSWQAFADGNKEMAAFGFERFANRVAYLATIRKDGAPRVHPMTPFIGEGHLFFYTDIGSAFWRDLQRDSRYALHSSVENDQGGGGEFFVSGYAKLTEDPQLKAIAEKYVPYSLEENYVLFELSIESAFSRIYKHDETGKAIGASKDRWKNDK